MTVNNINKRPTVILIFIALLSLLLQILWQTTYWSLLYKNGEITLPIQRDRSSSSKNQNQKRKRRIKGGPCSLVCVLELDFCKRDATVASNEAMSFRSTPI